MGPRVLCHAVVPMCKIVTLAFAVIYNKHHIICFVCMRACVLVCVCHVSTVCPCSCVRPLDQSVGQSVCTLPPPDLLEQLACSSSGRQRAVPPTHNWIISPILYLPLCFKISTCICIFSKLVSHTKLFL